MNVASTGNGAGEGKGWRQNVAAIIVDEAGNVLLGRKSAYSRYLHFPQGGVKRKEGLEEAVRREIREETGLPPSACRVLASLGGLRYRYRRKNNKSGQWLGQEQTYFLMACEGVMPGTDTSHSPEFGSIVWLPRQELDSKLFVPFKRKAVARVLDVFFPAGVSDWEGHIAALAALESCSYSPASGLGSYSPDDRSFFAGGKAEVQGQMLDLSRRLIHTQRHAGEKTRLLVIIWGLPGSGRINCLRHIAPCLDPLLTRLQSPREAVEEERLSFVDSLGGLLPAPGQVRVVFQSPYDLLAARMLADEKEEAMRQAAAMSAFEKLLQGEGIQLLKFYLNISRQEQAVRLGKETPPPDWETLQAGVEQILSATSSPVPWHIIPSDRRWYRNFMIGTFLARALEA